MKTGGTPKIRNRKQAIEQDDSAWHLQHHNPTQAEVVFDGLRVPTQLTPEQFKQLYLDGLEAANVYQNTTDDNPKAVIHSAIHPHFFMQDNQGLAYNFIKDPIGQGKFGAVYVGVNLDEAKLCVVKKIAKLPSPKDTQSSTVSTESSILNSLGRLQGEFMNDDSYYLFQDYAYGKTLRAYCADPNFKNTTLLEKVELAVLLVEKLQSLHAKGILHKDLKLDNIVYDQELGEVTLCDFGLSNFIGVPVSTFVGTPVYMAPEQFENIYTTRSDVYSLGVVLSLLFTRVDHRNLLNDLRSRTPFKAYGVEPDYARVHEVLKPLFPELIQASKPPSEDETLDPKYLLWKLLLSTLEADPSNRPSLESLKSDLKQIGVAIRQETNSSLSYLLAKLYALQLDELKPSPIPHEPAPTPLISSFSTFYLNGLERNQLDSSFGDLIPKDGKCCPCSLL